MVPNQEQLLTVDQLADLWQVKREWLYEQTRKKKIPHKRLGGHVRFRPSELDAYLEQNSVPPEAGAEEGV